MDEEAKVQRFRTLPPLNREAPFTHSVTGSPEVLPQ